MPRVDWEEHKRRLYPRWVWFVSVVAIVAIVLQIIPLVNKNVALASPSLPDNTLNSNNMTLVISQSADASVINAPDDYVKIYLGRNDTGTPKVDIWNPNFNPCNKASKAASDWDDPPNPCTTSFEHVHYDFFAMDANETNPASSPTPGSPGPMTFLFSLDGGGGAITGPAPHPASIGSPHNGWSAGIPLPISWTSVSNVTGYRVVLMKAHFASSTLPAGDKIRLHSYQMRVESSANDTLGYWEAPPGSPPPDGQYIIHYLGGQTNFMVGTTEFRFAPPCTVTSNQPAKLRWYDADWQPDFTLGQWYRHPFFYFYQIDQNGNQLAPIIIDGSSSPNLGTNNQYRELNFTAHPGWKYRWVWHNMNGPFGGPPINAANNIQMWLPYDSINYQLSCWDYHSTIASADGRAPGATLDFSNPANQTVKFWVDARNIGSQPGPNAHTTPTVSPGGWTTLETSDPTDPQVNNGDINKSIGGLSSDTSYFGHGAKYEYKFDPLTPNGVYCFGDRIAPNTSSIASAPSDNSICYTVKNNRRYPSVQGLNSDVHAGGGLCPAQNPGNVKGGNSISGGGANSYGQYVVSAAGVGAVGGTLNDFGSNNARGSTQLNIGASGDYQQICRKDLYAYATSNVPAGASWLPSGTYDVGSAFNGPPNATLVNGNKAVAYINGPVTLHGSYHQNIPLTLVVNGDLTVSGNITVSGGIDRNNAPSIGVIASGSIYIDEPVSTVDALLFSDSTIYTCYLTATPVPPQCDNLLTVHGFLMAQDIKLQRLGP